jgi:predicted lipoprotein with Yx(FWY)xxD motif
MSGMQRRRDVTSGRRHLTRPGGWIPLVALPAAAALGLAACSSSGGTHVASSSNTSTTASPPVVSTANSAKFGTILVDASGKTLYQFTAQCTGACLGVWPPLLLPAGTTTPTGGPGVTGLTTMTQGNGQQVAYMGHPLFTFSHDTSAGDTNGDGLNTFAGHWSVATVAGAPAPPTSPPPTSPPATAPAPSTTAPPSTMAPHSGGYGY